MKASKCKRNRAPPGLYFPEGKNIGREGPDRGTRSGLGEDQEHSRITAISLICNGHHQ